MRWEDPFDIGDTFNMTKTLVIGNCKEDTTFEFVEASNEDLEN